MNLVNSSLLCCHMTKMSSMYLTQSSGCVYMLHFKAVDCSDSVVGGQFCSHGSTSCLEVVLAVKLKVVHGEKHIE